MSSRAAQLPDPLPASPRVRPRVLLVDDRPANLLALEALLDPLEADTVRALNGREALQRAAEQDFAVILLDVQLPDLSGLEVTARLRAQGLNRRTPVLLVTAGDGDEQELLRGYAHGAVDFLRKPLVPEVLQAKVSVFLELFLAREAVREQEARRRERESEQRFRTLAEAMPQLVWAAGPDGEHDYLNQRFLDYTGATRGQTDTATWLQSMLPGDRATALARWRHSVATGEPFELEYRRRRHDGELRWLLGRALPVRDAKGAVTRWLGTSTDIEDQMRTVRELQATQAEVRRLNQDLEQRVQERTLQLQESNRELESFSYSVSHDLRAPLRHVTGFAQLLQKRAGAQLDETSRGYLKTIFEAAQQGGQLVDDLLAFSRMGRAALRRSRVQLGALVDEVVRELAPDARGRQVEWRVGELPEVQADPAMLRQVLRNLLANALKYTRPRERALIEVGAEPPGEAGEAGSGEVHVWVRDNGVGFEMQYVDKLFGVFQRLHTAEQFEGTGIGLANVKRVVTRHGGRVWAESTPGSGATFHFTLPVTAPAPRGSTP